MDSPKCPIMCYALGERTFGRAVRRIFNFFQSFQQIFNVALLIIGNSQILSVLISCKFCYVALNVFFMLVGITGEQIRSLKKFSWFTTINIWLNILVMVITVVGLYSSPPIPSVSNRAKLNKRIITLGWVPSYTLGWYWQVLGVQLVVSAYDGAMIFPGKFPLSRLQSAVY